MLLIVSLAACACGRSPRTTELQQATAQFPAAVERAVAFRFAGRRAADVRVYELPTLDEIDWRFDTPALLAERVLGFAPDDDQVYVLAPKGQLYALDLATGRARQADTGVVRAGLGPTGTALVAGATGRIAAVSGRRVVPVGRVAGGDIEFLWGTAGGRVVVVLHNADGRRLVTITGGKVGEGRPLPDGPLAVGPWGDVAAVATDSGVLVADILRGTDHRWVRLRDPVTALAFSASGHRLFAATAAPSLAVIDRFELDVLARIALDAPVFALRPDPWGRFLLGRAAEGLVAIEPAAGRARAFAGEWDEDLPAAAADGTVLARRGSDVLALRPADLAPAGRVAGAAGDRWLVARWDPRRPALQLAASEAAPAPATSAGATGGGRTIYVQVSSTSNAQWADGLARDLQLAGVQASVLSPTRADEMYRVVVGPYGSREEAESIGRKLGMPYWIFTRDSTVTRP